MYQKGIINIILIIVGLLIIFVLLGILPRHRNVEIETTTTKTYYTN
jgi:hypothetical protein